MSGQNPRLILEDRKTQTRRLVDLSAKNVLTKEQRKIGFEFFPNHARPGDYSWVPELAGKPDSHNLRDTQHLWVPIRHPADKAIPPEECGCARITCPFGEAGDRLWVKETHCFLEADPLGALIEYSDGTVSDDWVPRTDDDDNRITVGKHRPSIHMPRWASRITLEILKVRAERLQEISEEDCFAEGTPRDNYTRTILRRHFTPREWYAELWDSLHQPSTINHQPSGWSANPWVWVLEFKRLTSQPSTLNVSTSPCP